ncbi:nuclear transport factor 2 family protein [Paraliobacillus ryukyuensis]|uniref:nuclear transport factor 2 family protein n=1 Tax=Paraliobacillus ryukyuensis TaxID=200904 RepID=UPI0009A8DC8A|nr:DUF4440 domain-containing protein [Paraliobacillus ryukyuensis]
MDDLIKLKKHLYDLETTLLKPETRSSKETLEKLLGKNFFEIGSSGKFLYRNQEITDTGIDVVKMTLSEFEIHPLSEEIILTTYRIYNHETKQYSLRSSIWKYQNQTWKMQFHQGTTVKS